MPNTGKWLDTSTPKEGWQCNCVTDLGMGESQLCEMCETEEIRYVHHMRHSEGMCLDVGVICASHMESGSEDAVEKRMRFLKSRQTRRAKWTSLKWATTRKGKKRTEAVGSSHYQVLVYRKGTGNYIEYAYQITMRAAGSAKEDVFWSDHSFMSENVCMLRAFDHITRHQSLLLFGKVSLEESESQIQLPKQCFIYQRKEQLLGGWNNFTTPNFIWSWVWGKLYGLTLGDILLSDVARGPRVYTKGRHCALVIGLASKHTLLVSLTELPPADTHFLLGVVELPSLKIRPAE